MKRVWLVLLAACDVPSELAPWQLDHDRIVVVRAEPPHIAPGEVALLDGLVAHAGAPTTVEITTSATAPDAGDLFTAVHYNIDHWQIDGPDEALLAEARARLGLPAGAPVPLDVSIELAGSLYAQKTVWLGDSVANPTPPMIAYGPQLTVGVESTLLFEPPPGGSVRWLTSCGELRDDTTSQPTHVVAAPCDGELVLVVRDAAGGVAWQSLPLHAE